MLVGVATLPYSRPPENCHFRPKNEIFYTFLHTTVYLPPYLTVNNDIQCYPYFFYKKRCAIKSGKVLLRPRRPLAASNPFWDHGQYVTKDGVIPKMYKLISRSCNRTRRPQNFFGNFQTIHGRLIF